MKKICFSAILLMLLFSACEREGTGAPRCIEKKVKELSDNNPSGQADVKEYRFQERTVYVFDTGNGIVDEAQYVYDTNCNQIGFLGGLMGNQIINGQNFYDNAVYIQTIWSN